MRIQTGDGQVNRDGIIKVALSMAPEVESLSNTELERKACHLKESGLFLNASSRGLWADNPVFTLRNCFMTSSDRNVACALACVSEAIRRELGFKPYPVQLLAALHVARGEIIEMKTGEGKSLVAVMASCLAALNRSPVHVATTNAYLAERDAQSASAILSYLAISVGCVLNCENPQANKDAYSKDITFGPGYQFGFDYLMDQSELRIRNDDVIGRRISRQLHGQLSQSLIQPVKPGFAIIDEADSVLIDEATTPMILSRTTHGERNDEAFVVAKVTADSLIPEKDFRIVRRRVEIQSEAKSKILSAFSNISKGKLDRPWFTYVENALLAKYEYRKNEHYVVVDETVRIVDTQTGRIFEDRSWQNGLHQAIEAKERVPLSASRSILARITRQRFFQRYKNVSGMTGTIGDLGPELFNSYRSKSRIIPSHLQCQRVHHSVRMFVDWESKLHAIGRSVFNMQRLGRPVLIGTKSIAKSIAVCDALKGLGLNPTLLNGLQDRSEAEIIALSGIEGSVTVATNMAGRGTDIKLSEQARIAGGLHVIGTEPHESGRIDQQLIGRSARQGDPGSCQLFASCDDQLFEEAEVDDVVKKKFIMNPSRSGEIHQSAEKYIEKAQSIIERRNALQREKLMHHDSWLDSAKKGYESFA